MYRNEDKIQKPKKTSPSLILRYLATKCISIVYYTINTSDAYIGQCSSVIAHIHSKDWFLYTEQRDMQNNATK